MVESRASEVFSACVQGRRKPLNADPLYGKAILLRMREADEANRFAALPNPDQ